MNDYTKGASEALVWVQGLMGDLVKGEDRWDVLKREVDDAKEDIVKGVDVDLRLRLQRNV